VCQRKVLKDEDYLLTSSRVQATPTSVAFEVLGLLMVDEDLEVVEVTFTVVAPWSRQDFFHIGVASLLLRHLVACKLDTRPSTKPVSQPLCTVINYEIIDGENGVDTVLLSSRMVEQDCRKGKYARPEMLSERYS